MAKDHIHNFYNIFNCNCGPSKHYSTMGGRFHDLGICQSYSMGPSNKLNIFIYYSYIQVEFGNSGGVILLALRTGIIVHLIITPHILLFIV